MRIYRALVICIDENILVVGIHVEVATVIGVQVVFSLHQTDYNLWRLC